MESIKTVEHYQEKKETTYEEQDTQKVKAFLSQLSNILETNRVYVDECGINTYLHREYGYARKGVKIYGKIKGKRFKRTNIIAAQRVGKIIAPMQYEGMIDSKIFEHWFDKCLLPELPPSTVIILDNASFHKKDVLQDLAASHGCQIIFLPPYSPEYNPIEHFWSKLKRNLRKIIHEYASLDCAISAIFKAA